jgi:D-alanine-D-alanine ligase
LNRVLVLMGGTSEEREISLQSGANVCAALEKKGYQVESLDLNKDNLNQIADIAPDVVFIALHGKNGEDGTVQGHLDLLGIPYTGSGVTSSAICMNKILTKKLLSYEGLPTPDFIIMKKNTFDRACFVVRSMVKKFGLPMVVKAATQGSSIGTYIIKKEEEILPAIEAAFQYDDEVLVEQYIDGILLTASVLGNDNPCVLPIIEITSSNEFYDYESKYTPGMCEHIVPARISQELQDKICRVSEEAYKSLSCKGFARIDFMVDRQGQPYILEINTIPGLTDMSLVPDAARAVGISYEDLLERLLELALEKKG